MYDKDILGREGIPNIYVENISIEDSHDSNENAGVRVKVDMCFNNSLERPNRPVFQYANESSTPYAVRFVNFYNQQTFSAFLALETETQQHLYIRDQQPLGNLKVEYLDLPRLDISKLRMDKVTKIKIKKQVTLNSQIDTYAFSACIMKRDASSIGPSAAESVMIDGVVSKNSFYYVDPLTKQIWTGPIHKHEGVPMVGSFHVSSPHTVLEKVLSRNFKIKDYRETKPSEIQNTPDSLKQTDKYFFSSLEHSQGQNGIANLMFSFNTKQIMMNIGKYSGTLKQYNQAVFNSIAQNISIKKLKVTYQDETKRVRTAFSTKDNNSKLIEAYYYMDSYSSSPRKSLSRKANSILFSRVAEIEFDDTPTVRTIAFQLNSKEISDVTAYVELDDPFEKYLEDLLIQAKTQKRKLSDYRAKIFSSKYYSRETKTFNKLALVTDFENKTNIWYSPVDIFMKIKTLVEKMNESVTSFETDRAFENMSPKTCTPESVEYFINQFNRVLNQFVTTYSLRANNGDNTEPAGSKGGRIREYSIIKKYNIKYRKSPKAISYFRQINNQAFPVPVFTQTQFRNIVDNEKQKFQSLSFELQPELFRDPSRISAANDDAYDSSYLSPLTISNRNKNTTFGAIEKLNEEKLRDVATSKLEPNLGSLFGKNLHVELFEEPSANKSRAEKNLGTGTNFTNDVDLFEEQISSTKPNKTILRKMGSQTKQQRETQSVLSPTSEQNYFANKTNQEALRTPFQIRTLFNKQQIADTFGSEAELFNNRPFTADAAFFNLQKIVYYNSYQSDSNDRVLIGAPLLREYNSQSPTDEVLFCRLVTYEEPRLKNTNNFEDFTVINSFFVIVPDDFVFKKTRNVGQFQFRNRLDSNLQTSRQRRYYQSEYLRNTDNIEPKERKRHIPKQAPPPKGALVAASKKSRQRQEQNEMQRRKSKKEIDEQKKQIMQSKRSNNTQGPPQRSQQQPTPQQQRQQRPAPQRQAQQRPAPQRQRQQRPASQQQARSTPVRTGGGGSGY